MIAWDYLGGDAGQNPPLGFFFYFKEISMEGDLC